MEILLFCIGTIGMTHIIVDGTIFKWLRDLFDTYLFESISGMIHCHQCTGFWCGLFCGWAVFSNITWWQIFVAGCASSILSLVVHKYVSYIEALTSYTDLQTVLNVPKELEDDGK